MFRINQYPGPNCYRYVIDGDDVRIKRETDEEDSWLQVHKAGPFASELRAHTYGRSLVDQLNELARKQEEEVFSIIREATPGEWSRFASEERFIRQPEGAATPRPLEVTLRATPAFGGFDAE